MKIPERKAFRVIVSVDVEGSSDGRSFFCTLVNISVTGMMLEAANPLHEGDLVNASFFLHEQRSIAVQGKVVRAKAKAVDLFEYGIHFVVPPLEVRSAIEKFVEERRKAG